MPQPLPRKYIEEHWLKQGAHLIFQHEARNEAFMIVEAFIGRLESKRQ